eukprot:TRINITY_DN1336_c0_g1_i1.p1 TRINITY_DN1336_c0_g1~~TRINITY_DN1336_c0_g1_i1.p1  ORF type:complete len:451 (+),score=82.59 TRINITY_DN1336_c0_g1_i1:104-1456(+)
MSTKGSVLVLGAGYVAKPLVHYLSSHNFKVIVASRTLEKTESLVKGAAHATSVQADVEKEEDMNKIEDLVKGVDAVVSMLPYVYHVQVAKLAVKHKKHFFTTSYVSDAMKALEKDALDAGIVMINECGVDPGTDHMSAMRVINEVRKNGGHIVSFTSYCGGLPKPSDNNNPFGYKFSWAPRGVLLASKNSAFFLKDGKEEHIPGEVLFDCYQVEEVGDLGKFECYPNRNSTQYIDVYNLKGIKTMIRGTYRNLGWCRTVKKIADLGYLSLDKTSFDKSTYADVLRQRIGAKDTTNLKEGLANYLKLKTDDPIIHAIEWLGLLSDKPVPSKIDTHLDLLCDIMLSKMQYEKGEVDMLVMKHTFIAEYPEKKERQTITSTLIDYGIKDGDSSMSRTVSYPVAIVIRLVLEGKIKGLKGLQIPVIPELYEPILNELETLGIKFVEKWEDPIKY